jgi:hypothetical protein
MTESGLTKRHGCSSLSLTLAFILECQEEMVDIPSPKTLQPVVVYSQCVRRAALSKFRALRIRGEPMLHTTRIGVGRGHNTSIELVESLAAMLHLKMARRFFGREGLDQVRTRLKVR